MAPGDIYQIKIHKGLRPLVMLAQPQQVISQLNSDVTNQEHESIYKLKILHLQQNAAETIDLARMQTTFMVDLFGPRCPLARILCESICALTLLSQEYTGSNWVREVSNQYINKYNKASQINH